MAEKREMLVASNGCQAYFKEGATTESLWLDGRWPLDEFPELAEFVGEHQRAQRNPDPVDMKLSELRATEEMQTEGQGGQ